MGKIISKLVVLTMTAMAFSTSANSIGLKISRNEQVLTSVQLDAAARGGKLLSKLSDEENYSRMFCVDQNATSLENCQSFKLGNVKFLHNNERSLLINEYSGIEFSRQDLESREAITEKFKSTNTSITMGENFSDDSLVTTPLTIVVTGFMWPKYLACGVDLFAMNSTCPAKVPLVIAGIPTGIVATAIAIPVSLVTFPIAAIKAENLRRKSVKYFDSVINNDISVKILLREPKF